MATPKITHAYVSQNGDPPDPTIIGQTKWNEDHAIVLSADGVLVGRKTAGAGDAEELSASDVAAILAGEFVAPGDLATVATTGSYNDLTDKPTLGTAAAQDVSAFATSTQGSKADSALQNVVEDTTPQLGGDLDANGKKILLDTNFYLGWSSGNPYIQFDTSDAIVYDRTNNAWYFNIAAATAVLISASEVSPGASGGNTLGSGSRGWNGLHIFSDSFINFGNGDYTFTHSTGFLTANKDLRITTPGTDAASVATLEGTQTLKNKTIDASANTLSKLKYDMFASGEVKAPTVQIFTSSGTWTKPAGCLRIKATIIGGGGGAGGCSTTSNTQAACSIPGGAGGWCISYINVSAISSLAVTVGAAGAGGADGSTAGTAGGTSGLGSSNANGQATGGNGGSVGSAQSITTSIGAFGAPGAGSNGSLQGNGALGSLGVVVAGGRSTAGQGGHAAQGLGTGGNGGTSNNQIANGSNATGYGGGGGGAALSNIAGSNSASGGNGSGGIVIIEEYYA